MMSFYPSCAGNRNTASPPIWTYAGSHCTRRRSGAISARPCDVRSSCLGGEMSQDSAVVGAAPRAAAPDHDRRRWLALAVIALAQLMVVLDATIVNIALPHAQEALKITDANRQWIVTAYTLTFGGL